MQDARDALQRSQMFADALQSQVNGLTADFTARDDPAQRAVVGDNRQKALAELDRVKNDIVQQTNAIFSAIRRINTVLLKDFVEERAEEDGASEEMIKDLIKAIDRVTK